MVVHAAEALLAVLLEAVQSFPKLDTIVSKLKPGFDSGVLPRGLGSLGSSLSTTGDIWALLNSSTDLLLDQYNKGFFQILLNIASARAPADKPISRLRFFDEFSASALVRLKPALQAEVSSLRKANEGLSRDGEPKKHVYGLEGHLLYKKHGI